jgi:hypothetical protein
MSAVTPKADISERQPNVRFVPIADILARALLRLVYRSRASYF